MSSERFADICNPGRVIQIAHDTHHPKYNLWSGGIPAIWRHRAYWGLWHKLVIVWGTSEDSLVCHPYPVPKGVDQEQVRSVRHAATKVPWDYERNLRPDDVLPGVDGPTVGDYAARNHCDGIVTLEYAYVDTATGKETPACPTGDAGVEGKGDTNG